MMPVELGARALWTLTPISILAGLAARIAFRLGTDRLAVRRVTNLMLAHLLEFRLFLDEPVLMLRAQRELILANLRLLRLIFVPCLALGICFFFLVRYMDDWYGRGPLPPGRAVVITGSIANLPKQLAIETPELHFGGQVMWRARPKTFVPVLRGSVIPFPAATILRLHWLIWFSMISAVAAVGLRWLV